jgi:outer membrane protein OmpA-like peptidoglycan-associated protein
MLCLLVLSQSARAIEPKVKGDDKKPVFDYVMNIDRSTLAVVDSNVVVSIQITAIQDVPATQSVVLKPVLVDTITMRQVELPMIFINSRNQQIYFDRGKKKDYPDAIIMRKKNGKDLTIDYLRTVKYEPWMDNAVLKLRRQSCACDNMKNRGEIEIARFEQEDPIIELYPVYLLPPADNRMKVREEKGSALLCFELNKWDIKPNYMTNPVELQKIHNSVNIVKSDSDVTIRRMTIEGYASPEGSVEVNQRISENRANAVKTVLVNRYQVNPARLETQGMGATDELFDEVDFNRVATFTDLSK